MKRKLALTVLAVLLISIGVMLVVTDLINARVGLGAALVTAGVALWLLVANVS